MGRATRADASRVSSQCAKGLTCIRLLLAGRPRTSSPPRLRCAPHSGSSESPDSYATAMRPPHAPCSTAAATRAAPSLPRLIRFLLDRALAPPRVGSHGPWAARGVANALLRARPKERRPLLVCGAAALAPASLPSRSTCTRQPCAHRTRPAPLQPRRVRLRHCHGSSGSWALAPPRVGSHGPWAARGVVNALLRARPKERRPLLVCGAAALAPASLSWPLSRSQAAHGCSHRSGLSRRSSVCAR